jgi:hypothetical protein
MLSHLGLFLKNGNNTGFHWYNNNMGKIEKSVDILIGGPGGAGFGVTEALADELVRCCSDKIVIVEKE